MVDLLLTIETRLILFRNRITDQLKLDLWSMIKSKFSRRGSLAADLSARNACQI